MVSDLIIRSEKIARFDEFGKSIIPELIILNFEKITSSDLFLDLGP